MKLSLVVMTAGKTQGQAIPVTLSQFIIGRDPQCNLRPGSAIISKRHCAVLVKDGKVSVRDFESTNGTFINGQQIKGEIPVNNGDILKLGPLEFKIAIEAKAPASKPTPPPSKPAAAKAEDDSVAAMLLSLGDAEKAEDGSTSSGEGEVPAGSTVMDVVALPPDTKEDQVVSEAAPKEKPPEQKKPDPKKGDPAHLAAKAILEKYTRRQRG